MKQGKISTAWIFFSTGFLLYTASITFQGTNSHHNTFQSGGLPPAAQQLLAGPYLGAASDLNILSVFSTYDDIRNKRGDSELLWTQLHQRLVAAQTLDPWFWDTYRLTTGLMGFHELGASQAVQILSKGSVARYWDWESPFIAAYLAHEILHDDKHAYELMRLSIERPNAPSLAIGLAAQFLESSKGSDASIRFLQYLRLSMPAQYREVIDARIKRLQQKQDNVAS